MQRYDRDRGYARGRAGGRYGEEYGRDFGGGWSERFRGGQGGWGGWGGRGGAGGGGYDRGVYGEEYPGYDAYSGGWGRQGGAGRFRGEGSFGGGAGRMGGWYRYDEGYRSGGDLRRGGWSGGSFEGGGRPGGGGGRGFRGRFGESDRGSGGGRGGEWGGWSGGRPWDGGYDFEYPREPFMPDEAYLRHPEYERPQPHRNDRWPGAAAGGQGGYRLMDDDEILQAVRQNLFQDNWVDAERIEVSVEDGVVTLTGEVDDFLEARYAWDDAWETSGVRGVVNHIHVSVEGSATEQPGAQQRAGGKAKGKSGSTG